MGNYNPRQNTRMRWKDARELEKFIFLSGRYNFEEEILEHVLEDKLYGKIATEILECLKKNIRKGIIVEDIGFGGCYIGEICDDGTATLININASSNNSLELQINRDDENNIKLEIYKTYEAFLTSDNVKTLFGQNITGTGDITMYRHDLTFTEGNGDKYVGVVYSSKNLEVNTFDKLATLIGKSGNQNILVVKTTAINETTKDATNIRVHWYTEGFVWLAKNNTGTINVALGEVSDVVTPI